MNINWYPGHMTKAKRELIPKLKLIDLVIEVIDARAPASSLNPDFETLFFGKSKIYILNKADMADDATTKKWVAWFEQRGDTALAFSAAKGDAKILKRKIEEAAVKISKKYADKGRNKIVRAIVCGIPNVGKSAILNRLAGAKRVKEGNRPGVTRGLQWVRLSDHLEIMDSPGLLWPKIENERSGAYIALIGSIKQEILDEEQLAYYLLEILKEKAPRLLCDRYGLGDLEGDAWDIMLQICKKRGFLLRGGEIDSERGVKMLLEEFKNARLGRFSLETPRENTEHGKIDE